MVDHRGELRGEGQRVSRYYYDLFRLLASPTGKSAASDMTLAVDCVAHAQMFFFRRDFDLADGKPGTFTLMPTDGMTAALRTDYRAMSSMIFGKPPEFDEILDAIQRFEQTLNSAWRVGGKG